MPVLEAKWFCGDCKSIIRFNEDEPMTCFAQGMIAGLLLVYHRKSCRGDHYENGKTGGPSLEQAFLGAVEGKTWPAIEAASNPENANGGAG
jgi:hypothetical protein